MKKIRTLMMGALCVAVMSTSAHAQIPGGGGPIVPFCSWKLLSSPTRNVYFNAFGYTGHERLIRIHSGNYDTTNLVIDYTVEVIWDPSTCSGEVFTVRFPLHGTTDHVEIEAYDSSGLLGGINHDIGSLPVPYNQTSTNLTTSDLGPFVITPTMSSQMSRTVTFFLLDEQILSRLPEPAFFNGAAPTNWLQELLMGAAYQFVVGQNLDLFEYYQWRRDLEDMGSAAQTRAATAIDTHIYDPGTFAATVWEDHSSSLIDHGVGYTAMTASMWGGFWNGHRHYLESMESYLASVTDSERVGFRRIPNWHPTNTIPSAFNINISNTSPSIGVNTNEQAANICDNYPSSLSTAATLADRLLEVQEMLHSAVNGWHGSVHIAIGGDMGDPVYAARAPIFFAWHEAVDAIWRNWQLCEAGWDDAEYTWP